MDFGNPSALLDDVDASVPIAKVQAEMAVTAASTDYAARGGRGGYGRGFSGRGRGRGRGFHGNGRIGNNGNGAGWINGYNGGRGRGGYGYGGGFRGQMFDGRNGRKEACSGVNLEEENTNNGNYASVGKIPETTEVMAKNVESGRENADQAVSEDLPQNNESSVVDEEEEKHKKREEEYQRKMKERWEKERQEDAKKLTLPQYYSKVFIEKKKALEPFLKVAEVKVVPDEEFKGMQIIGKKKEEEIFVKLGSRKEKSQKKNNPEKEEKLCKSLSLDEFRQPTCSQRYRPAGNNSRGTVTDDQCSDSKQRDHSHFGRDLADRPGRGPRVGGQGRGRGFGRRMGQDPVKIEDPRQFPDLGKTSKVEAQKP